MFGEAIGCSDSDASKSSHYVILAHENDTHDGAVHGFQETVS
jgi:hypothetical protein